jgi:tetratricopeptide (TPR) repeat protein/DNA-binding CsgD family transcriptional regulator
MEENGSKNPPIFSTSIETINGIRFTAREIDILACILFGKSSKKIALLLNLSPRTVENYTRNITQKLDCNSRERIQDFLESSENLQQLKQHYLDLQLHVLFEQYLKGISKQNPLERPSLNIKCWGNENNFVPFLEKHIKIIGIKVSIETQKAPCSLDSLQHEIKNPSGEYNLYIIPMILFEAMKTSNRFSLSSPKSLTLQIKNEDLILLSNHNNKKPLTFILPDIFACPPDHKKKYYLSVIEILSTLLPSANFETLIKKISLHDDENTSLANFIKNESENSTQGESAAINIIAKFPLRKKWHLFAAGFSILFSFYLGFNFLVRYDPPKPPEGPVVRSDLIIPVETKRLDRQDLIAKINDNLKNQSGIRSIALVGIGGSGKTTLAHQYARSQKSSVVWEINAETAESLKISFDRLADKLIISENDKKLLNDFEEIKDQSIKQEKVTSFIKEKLRKQPNWLLVFDNVAKFSDIQSYYPSASELWGTGTVIITTRDNHIQQNNQLKTTLFIGELNSQQKLNLFTKIMANDKSQPFSKKSIEECKIFLKNLPPFPLDISVAAYYIRATQVSYNEYLENLRKDDGGFRKIQETMTKEASNYSNSRFHIITTSLEELITTHNEFPVLLLLISLVDTQNIPRDLLNSYNGNEIAENFIYHLKKYSLVTGEVSVPSIGSEFSIHRSTQEISLSYLTSILEKELKYKAINHIVETFERYFEDVINNEDFSKMNQLINHLETILSHENILIPTAVGVFQSELGYIYYYLGYYDKALALLKKSLINLGSNPAQNQTRKARVLSHLGKVYREIGDYKTAENFLTKSVLIYEGSSNFRREYARTLGYLGYTYRNMEDFAKASYYLKKALGLYHNDSESPIWVAWLLAHLGAVDHELGEYEKAKQNLEKSLKMFHPTQNAKRISWVEGKLGRVYQELGDFPKAKELMEQSLENHQKRFSDTHSYVGWILLFLGDIYGELGEFKVAKALCEKSLDIHNKLFGKDNLRTLGVFVHLGNAYLNLGEVDKGLEYIEKTLIAYEKHYGQNHLETARVLRSLGRAFLLKDNTEKAEVCFVRALTIFERKTHPNTFMIYEDLSRLNSLKSRNASREGKIEDSKNFTQRSLSNLKHALQILHAHFPKDSPHIMRINNKINKVESKI